MSRGVDFKGLYTFGMLLLFIMPIWLLVITGLMFPLLIALFFFWAPFAWVWEKLK